MYFIIVRFDFSYIIIDRLFFSYFIIVKLNSLLLIKNILFSPQIFSVRFRLDFSLLILLLS
jgi:hypothetical protein